MTEIAAEKTAAPASLEAGSVKRRKRWIGVLAKANSADLEAAWSGLSVKPDYEFLRRPEVGLCMVRARAGGSGVRFNLGEMTMTRCAVRLASGTVGYGYVAGRKPKHAELAAVFDALLQDSAMTERIEAAVIDGIEAGHLARRRDKASKTAATKVEFFTMVRGGN